MKVSVIIPAYNSEKYIARCIDSVLRQSLEDLEVIIVNDGSTDQTQAIIDQFLTDSRLRVVQSPSNEGIIRTKEKGVKLAKGDYILFVDNDDWIALDTLEKLYNYAIKEDADMVYYNFYQVIGNIGYPQPGIKEPLQTFKDHLTDESIRSIYHCTLWRKLIRRSHIQAIDFSKMPSINYWEDWVVGVLLTLNEPKVAYLDEYLYFWNMHPESTVGTIRDRCTSDIIQAFDFVTDVFKELGLYEQYKYTFKQRLEEHTAWMESVKEQNLKCANEMMAYYQKWIEAFH